jgi:hypothetical protein
MSFRFYAVKRGRGTGIFESLQEVQARVEGLPPSKVTYRGCFHAAINARAYSFTKMIPFGFQASTIATKQSIGYLEAMPRLSAASQPRASKLSHPPASATLRNLSVLLPRLLVCPHSNVLQKAFPHPSTTRQRTVRLLSRRCPTSGASWMQQVARAALRAIVLHPICRVTLSCAVCDV